MNENAQVEQALQIARKLTLVGIPVFIAKPDPSNAVGYLPPSGWQNSVADPSVIDRWAPGMALCAVMGHGLDCIDVDPRNGGELGDLPVPTTYGIAQTPSGGVHALISSLGVAKRTNLLPGVDIQAGDPSGSGRGFIFIAPTVGISKVTGDRVPYRWVREPDLDHWRAATAGDGDASGHRLRELMLAAKSGSSVEKTGGPDWWQDFLRSREPQSAPAADKAIEEKLAEVKAWDSSTGVGFRTVLLRAAMTLGGYVGGDHLDEDTARTKLEYAVSCVWGAPDDNDRLWIEQGLTDGQAMPFSVYTAADMLSLGYTEAEVLADGTLWTFYDSIGQETFEAVGNTDQELAESVLERVQPGMRFAMDAGNWLVRQREVWVERRKADAAAISALAKIMPLGDTDFPKSTSDYTAEHWAAKRRMKFLNNGTSSAIASKMNAVVQIEGHSGQVDLAKLDSENEILWAGGLPYDLRASVDRPALAAWVRLDAPHMHTALCPPDPDCPTPNFDRFLAAVLPDPEVRAWAMRVLSIGLTGYPDAALPILYGRERSGKTSLIEILMEVLGTYGRPANAKLLDPKDNSHDSIIYELKGCRMAFIDEGPRKGQQSNERLKQITGGGSLTASKKYGQPITFKPTHTLVMTTNNEPELTDPALRARARLIPCDSPEAAVKPLRQVLLNPAALRAEAPGILSFMMSEAGLWLADRNSASTDAAPESIRGMSQEIAEGQDPVREWVLECCAPADPGTPGRQLFSLFAEWHQSKALYRKFAVPSETAFGRTLTDMGYPAVKKAGGVRYRPLTVLGGPGFLMPTPSTYMNPGRVMASVGGIGEGSGTNHPNPPDRPLPALSLSSSSSRDSRDSYIEEKIYGKERGGEEGKKGETTQLREIDREKPSQPAQPATAELGPAETVRAGMQAGSNTTSPPTKAQIRAQEKEAARLEAVAEAQGEILSLPAVVDRAGNVIPISEYQAINILTKCLDRTDGSLTVDVETSGYPVGHKHYKLRSVQLGDEVAAVVLDPEGEAFIIERFLREATTLHAHSASADLVPLAVEELVDFELAWEKMIDTVIPAKLGDPKSTGSDPGLKQIAGAVLGEEATAPAADEARLAVFKAGRWITGKQKFGDQLKTAPERNGWSQIDTRSEVMLRYAASDVLDTAAFPKRLPPIPAPILSRERTAEQMTSRITFKGLPLDYEKIQELTAYHEEQQRIYAGYAQDFGIDKPGSSQQVAAKFLEFGVTLPQTEAGSPSVAAHVLKLLQREPGNIGHLAGHILDYKHSSTALGLFLEPYRLLCEVGDGRARPTIYTLGTDTGRMSSVRPNFQQLPRSGGVRPVVVADPGMCLISADFSGVELRGAAALSQDPAMMHMIREEDEGRFDGFHWQVARQAFGAEANKEHRYIAKRGCFGTFYGGGPAGLAKQVGVPEGEMRIIIDSLKTTAPTFFVWADAMRQAVRNGATQFPAYSGRIIHLPPDTPHKAPAYAIQGTCRELLVDGLIRWRDTRWGNSIILPVHDEIIAMVPIEDAVEATEALVQCMQSELYGVKIIADPGPREEWGSTYWRDST